jgi:polyphosphate kinase 2 (PPK2 family)
MLKYTSTDFAPWHVIPSQDKKYGRILTLKTISEAIEDRFRQKTGRHF